MIERFCDCQIKCREDTDGTWTCTAHWGNNVIIQCKYISYKDSQKGEFPCIDARTYQEGLEKKKGNLRALGTAGLIEEVYRLRQYVKMTKKRSYDLTKSEYIELLRDIERWE